jgi:hypothetical protein
MPKIKCVPYNSDRNWQDVPLLCGQVLRLLLFSEFIKQRLLFSAVLEFDINNQTVLKGQVVLFGVINFIYQY